jgi:hypothetical protein
MAFAGADSMIDDLDAALERARGNQLLMPLHEAPGRLIAQVEILQLAKAHWLALTESIKRHEMAVVRAGMQDQQNQILEKYGLK